jgi:hypothetical protein
MNTASTDVTTNPVTQPGVPAPITRIGGGEVRVDRALASTTAAWDAEDLTASLSFGYQALHDDKTFVRRVAVRNYGSVRRTYAIQPSFRFPADAASGALSISAPAAITVPAGKTGSFAVKLHVVADRLPLWTLNGGSRGGDGFRLQDVEFDGYVRIVDGTDDVHVAWQILPHRAAAVRVAGFEEGEEGGEMPLGSGTYTLSNADGAVDGRVDVFSLTGTSRRIQKKLLPGPGDNFAVVDLASVGVRLVNISATAQGLQFAINTHGARAHPNYPAEFDIYVDRDRDGTPDAVIFNLENGGFGATGQNVVAAGPLPSGPFTISFFTDADLNSGNAILTASLAALGLTATTQFDFSVYAFDNYFTGNLTDAIESMTYTAATPRFSSAPQLTVPVGGTAALAVSEVPGGDTASPSQRGLLLLFRDARPNKEAAALKIRR